MKPNANAIVLMDDTWDDATVTQSAIDIDIRDTGSADDSTFIKISRNGTPLFSVDKNGAISSSSLAIGSSLSADTTVDLGTYNLLLKTNNTAMNAVIQGPVSIADWETFAPTGVQGFVALGNNGNGGGSSFFAVDFSNGATGPGLFLNKTRGTAAAPAALQSGDAIGGLYWGGYDGSAIQNPAIIEAVVTGAVSAGVIPTDMVISMGGSVGGSVEAGRIKDDGTLVWVGQMATSAAAPTLSSGTTIAPTKAISFVSGTTDIVNITAPAAFAAGGGQITLIPTGIWHTTNDGNIAIASTAVVSKPMTLFYDHTTAKWYPSY
jgi:hypothetical protein